MFNMSRKINVEHKYIYYKHNKDSITKNQKGFTLVEMLVTLVVLGILLSISVGGLVSWQDWSRFNKMNEYAQTMFLSAQNQLTEYSENGKLKDFEERVSKQESMLTAPDTMIVNLEGLVIDKSGNTYDLDEVWKINQDVSPEDRIPDDEKYKYRSNVYSAKCNQGDYSLFISGAQPTSETAWIVFELLGSYVYDTSLLDAAICVEFTASDGQIFSVSYCDVSETSFTYDYSQTIDDLSGVLNIAKREEFYRRDRMIGYYGVDTLSKATDSNLKKPVISVARLNNEETLNLSFKITSVPSAAQQMSFSIDIVDTMDDAEKDNDRVVLNLTLDGTKLKNFDNRQEISCPVRRYTYDNLGNADIKTLGNYDILAWIEDDCTIRVVLDAVDVSAMTYYYGDYITTLNRQNRENENNAGFSYVDYIDETKGFPNSYSFKRFAVGAENIYCIIQGSSPKYKSTAKKETINKENVYFASGTYSVEKETDAQTGILFEYDKYDYSITNARHLYNMRFVEDFSGVKLKELNDHVKNSAIKATFSLDADIDWSEFAMNGYVFDTSFDGVVMVSDAYFPSIKQLRYDDSFTCDNDYAISGLKISEENNIHSLIYDIVDKDGNPVEEVKGPTGLFVQNLGNISGITMDEINVTGGEMVGAFCGKNAGSLENLVVKNTDNKSVIQGKSYVGGILGHQVGVAKNNSSDENIEINKDIESADLTKLDGLVNYAHITGEKCVGGVLGIAKIPEKLNLKIEINECKNFGVVEASKEEDEAMYIGGIVGYCQNLFEENQNVSLENHSKRIRLISCESRPLYLDVNLKKIFTDVINGKSDEEAKQLFKDKNNGVYVGGIVGYNYYGTIENCKTVSEVKNRGYVFGYQYVGGIVGYNQGVLKGLLNESGNDNGINTACVVGNKYVGGIVGCNADISDSVVGKALDANNIDRVIEPSKVSNLNVKVSNWVNKGIVYAVDCYAGGIAGYNAGWIYNCNSKTNDDVTKDFFQETLAGDYAGGVAGYNCGVMGNTGRTVDSKDSSKSVINFGEASEDNKITSACDVAGHNFVGGIVGYNDESGIIEDYELSGGNVKSADGDFVGGFAGFNSSIELLQDTQGNAKDIISYPDSVDGKYFVGGVIGGNIINTNGHDLNEAPDNPDTPDNPDEPDKPDEPEQEGLVATLSFNGEWENNGYYYANLVFRITNNTDKTIENWKVKVKPPVSTPDILYGGFWNCNIDSIDENAIVISPMDFNKIIWPNSTYEFGINEFRTTSKEARDAYINSVLTAYGEAVTNNNKGLSQDKLPYYVDFNLVENTSSDYYHVAKYSLNIENRTANDLHDWKIRIDLPTGGKIMGLWGGSFSLDSDSGTLLVTKPLDQYNERVPAGTIEYPGRLSSEIIFQIEYNDISLFPTLTDSRVRLYEGDNPNPVYDSGENAPDDDEEEDDPTDVPGIPDAQYRINASFISDDFEGSVNGKAFVGGFIGYNMFVDSDNEYCMDYIQDKLLEEVNETDDNLLATVESLDNLKKGTVYKDSNSEVELYIEGKNQNERDTNGTISGDIFVSGVLGYNDLDTRLYIDKVVNNNYIVAKQSIENEKEQTGRADGRLKAYDGVTDYTYSYAGGIIGKVNSNVTINLCKNSAADKLSTKGTYTGGICEVNEGRILNCDVSDIGSGSSDYVGGVVGLNEASYPRGVFNCNILNKRVWGRSYVGGVVAENLGYIRTGVSMNANVEATGVEYMEYDKNGTATGNVFEGVSGGTAAYNYGIIELYSNPVTNGHVKDINVVSAGNYAGGISGINGGRIINKKTDGKIVVSGNVTGKSCIGGIIGENRGNTAGKIANYCNEATIKATDGMAGGIVGSNKSKSKIYRCDNRNVVQALSNGQAGGITAYNDGVIKECDNYAQIMAPDGSCAGIAVTNGSEENNDAKIQKCNIIGNESSRLSFKSNHLVGGIVSVNYGTISDCMASYCDFSNITGEFATNIGAIAGENYGTINLDEGNVVSECTAKTYSNGSNIGGIAGINHESGNISGKEWYEKAALPITTVNCDISFVTDGEYVSNFGGIAGKNNGTIRNCAVKANIEGAGGSKDNGYGGIAGVQGETIFAEGSSPSIYNCTFDGSIYSDGTFDNPARTGGITGINGYNSIIDGCRISVFSNTDTNITGGNETGSYSYLGGIAGMNYGMVNSCDNYDENNKTSVSYPVNITANQGIIGGIIGYNEASGEVFGTASRCTSTGMDWTLEIKTDGNDNSLGGIIGYNASDKDISNVYNYAKLTDTNSGSTNGYLGGIIGRSENKNASKLTIKNAINYGDIEASAGASGICAVIKYSGVSFENCVNYGNLKAGKIVSGITGIISDIEEANLLFTNCQNHGSLTAAKQSEQVVIGGIVSKFAGDTDNVRTYYTNCVNTGIISYGNNPSSVFGGIIGAANGKSVLSLCRNYSTGNIYGIVGDGESEIYDSIDFSGTNLCPLGKEGTVNGSNNYFVDGQSNYFANTETTVMDNYGSRLYVSENNGLYSLYLPNSILAMNDLNYNPASDNYYYDKNDYINSYYRIPAYNDIDPKYMNFVYSNYYVSSKLEAPSNLVRENGDGAYVYSWDPIERAYGYEVRYRVVRDGTEIYSKGYYGSNEHDYICSGMKDTDSDPIYVSGRQFYEIKYDNSWKDSEIIFEVRAIEGNQPQNGRTEFSSDWVTNNGSFVQELNVPKVHLEVVGDEEVIAVLDNYEDYKDVDCTVLVWVNNSKKFAFEPEKQYSMTSQKLDVFSNSKYTNINAKVVVNEKEKQEFADSSTMASKICLYGTKELNENNDVYSVDFDNSKFYGSTISDLSYQMKLEADRDCYVASDLMAFDEKTNCQVAYAHRNTHVTELKDENVKLDNLTTDVLGKDINISTYLWASQGNLVRYGHIVAETVTAKELEDLVDKNFYKETKEDSHSFERVSQSIWINDEAGERLLKPGYVIYLVGDNKFSVLFNGNCPQVEEFSYKLDEQKSCYVASDGTKIPLQDKPVIGDIEVCDNKYSFKWDKTGNVYSVNLMGETIEDEDGNKKQANLGYAKDWSEASKEFIDESECWNYPRMILSVVNVGQTDDNGVTIKFPACSTRLFNVKIPFTRIPAVSMELVRDENDSVSKNELKYNVTWNQVPLQERKDLEGYFITVASMDDEPTDTHYYYEETKENNSDDFMTKTIDLSDYKMGENVAITVRAVAKTGEEVSEDEISYKDGFDSAITQLVIPTRLNTPSADMIVANFDGKEIPDIVSAEEFDNTGVTLSLDSHYFNNENERYQIAMSVHEDKGTEAIKNLIEKDSPSTIDVHKSGDVGFTYMFEEGESWSDYSGKWLRISVRSVSDDNISSYWSDDDIRLSDSMKYKWIKLPKVKIDPPLTGDLKIDCENYIRYYDFNSGELSDEVDSDYVISSRALGIKMPKYSDSLEIQVVLNEESRKTTVRWYYIERNTLDEESYDVYTVSTDDDITNVNSDRFFGELSEKLPYCRTNHYASTYLGSVSAGEGLDNLLYDVDFDNVEFSKECKVNTKLLCTNKDEFLLVLPDINGVSITGKDNLLDTGDRYVYTDNVCVKAINTDTTKKYVDSSLVSYYRKQTNEKNEEVMEIVDEPAAPQVEVINQSRVNGNERFNFVSDIEGNYVCHFVITDSDGKLFASKYCIDNARYLSIDSIEDAWGSVVLDMDLSDADYDIDIMFAVIKPGMGIGPWCRCEVK